MTHGTSRLGQSRIRLMAYATLGLALLFVSPGAFFLGMPVPTGPSSLSKTRSGLIPWAWGMDGALSVTGTALARLISIQLSAQFRITFLSFRRPRLLIRSCW